MFQVNKRPYVSAVLNRMEITGLAVSAITMYIGLLMFSDITDGMRQFLTLLIVLINCAWFVIFGSYFFKRVAVGKSGLTACFKKGTYVSVGTMYNY